MGVQLLVGRIVLVAQALVRALEVFCLWVLCGDLVYQS